MQVIVGDINAKNIVFRMRERPTVMIIDCDGMRPMGASSPTQWNSPDWDPPENADFQNMQTDLYKLRLFILRCLTPGRAGSINRDPRFADGKLDPRGLEMLSMSLSEAPRERPTAKEWHRYLNEVLARRS